MARTTGLRILFAALVVTGMFFHEAPVRAQGQPPQGIAKDLVEGFGKAVLTCIRPSTLLAEPGFGSRLVESKIDFPTTNRMNVSIRMGWHGAITQAPYESSFTIKMLRDGTSLEILGIDYTDNCLFPAPDLRLINGLIRELNNRLAKTPQQSALEGVLKQDRVAGKAGNAAQIAAAMRNISLQGCPIDFQDAYRQHILAWERNDAPAIRDTFQDVLRIAMSHRVDASPFR